MSSPKIKEVVIPVNLPPIEAWGKLLLSMRNLRKEEIIAHIEFRDAASFSRKHFTGYRIENISLQKERIMVIKITKKDLISEIFRLIRRDEAIYCSFFIHSSVKTRKKNKKPKKRYEKQTV